MYFRKLDAAIAAYLKTEGITQAEMAERMGMSENTFSWKRRGSNGREFKMSEAVKLAEMMGASIDELAEMMEEAA